MEFVSANPTGPLHVGHGRQAALGDAIAALLEWTGHKVAREFYYNDAGAQIVNLAPQRPGPGTPGRAAMKPPFPEGGYHGEYIKDIAATYCREHPRTPRPRGWTSQPVRGSRAAEGAGPRSQGLRRNSMSTSWNPPSTRTARLEAVVALLEATGPDLSRRTAPSGFAPPTSGTTKIG